MPSASHASLLQPWLPTLVEMQLKPEADRHDYVSALDDDAPLWLAWGVSREASPLQLKRRFEAMELLVLLAFVDQHGWRDVIQQLVDADPHPLQRTRLWASVLHTNTDRTVSGYDLVCTDQADVTFMRAYLAHEQDEKDEIARAFECARAVLEACLLTPVVIPVRLRMHLQTLFRFGETLPSIVEFAAFHSAIRGSCRLARLRSRFKEMINDRNVFTRADERFLRHTLAMFGFGLGTAALPRLDVQLSPDNTVFMVQALHTLLSPPPGSRTQGVTHVDVFSPTMAVPLWSAVAGSSVESVDFCPFSRADDAELDTRERRRTVQWFAYAMLCARAQSEMPTKLHCGRLTSQDVQWMQEVITARDPLLVLYEDDQQSIEDFKSHSISTTKVSLYDPTAANEAAVAISGGLPLQDLRVLKRDGEWWVVLVPGWGCGWIHTTDAVVTATPLGSAVFKLLLEHQSPLNLSVNAVDASSRKGALALIQLVGHRVHRLCIADTRGPGDTWCPAIFTACPNLTKLEIRFDIGIPARLARLTEIFARGLCPKLTRVSLLFDFMAYESFPDIVELLRALADSSHAMAKQLEVFSVETNNMSDGRDIVDSDMHAVALALLESNTHLKFLKLHLPVATSTPERVPEITREFAHHHNVVVPEDRNVLGPREKAAFLSVAWGQDSHASSGLRWALQQLDSAVVSSIFQFVPRPRYRLIDIVMPYQVHHDQDDEDEQQGQEQVDEAQAQEEEEAEAQEEEEAEAQEEEEAEAQDEESEAEEEGGDEV